MRGRLGSYPAVCLAGLAAAGGVWAWSESHPKPQAAAAPAAEVLEEHFSRPSPPTPARALAERKDEDEPPPAVEAQPQPEAGVGVHDDPPEQLLAASAQPAPAELGATDQTVAAEPGPARPNAVLEDPEQAPASPAPTPAQPREVSLTRLQLWSQPGMCAASGDAVSARAALSASFRLWDGGNQGLFHVDPRLPLDAITPILGDLTDAESRVAKHLKLSVARPETFLYFDRTLLTAAACINSDVAAYYDGALHVVASDADVGTSVVHEYTHHALISSGLLGPAWAQEGLAMNIAEEKWWQNPHWYKALLDHPFGIDDLDDSIPYKLEPEQATQFYAQSAALVACVLETKKWEPAALFAALRRSAAPGQTLVYELPEVERPSFLRGCLEHWYH